MRSHAITAALACLFFAALTHAQQRADASKMDVAGVTLGMTMEEAKSAASSYLHASPSNLYTERPAGKNEITGNNEPKYFTVKQPNVNLLVHFLPDPKSGGVMRAYLIKYEITWTKQNEDAMREAAINKYGAPSNHPNSHSLSWCIDPNKNLGLGCGMTHNPSLKLAGTAVELIDPSRHEALQQWRNARMATKPSF